MINELIFNILLEPDGLVTNAVADVVTVAPTTFPKIFATFTMFGFAMLFSYYPNTIAIAIALPVVTFPSAPFGMLKFKVAAELVPTLVTVAAEPAAPVVTVPIATVAALPATPCGMPKFKVAAAGVPTLVTVAKDPAAPVVTVPMFSVPELP
jgi:hypothetical protein